MSAEEKQDILARLQRECDIINEMNEVWGEILADKTTDEQMELTKWRYRPNYKFHPENCRARRTADQMFDLEEGESDA